MTEVDFIGKPIRSLQTMLRAVSNWNEAVVPVVPDGIYGNGTMASVSSFQQAYGLPVTGVSDLNTWESLVEAYDNAMLEIGPAAPLILLLQPGQIIIPNEANVHMYLINGMLQALAGFYPSMPWSQSGGVHTSSSVDAIKWLQNRSQLEPTGSIDRRTWRMLANLYRGTAGDGTKPPPRRKEE